MKTNKGFTLIELLVVITIVVIIGAIATGIIGLIRNNTVDDPTAYMSISDKAFYEEQKRANDIRERELQLQAQQQQK